MRLLLLAALFCACATAPPRKDAEVTLTPVGARASPVRPPPAPGAQPPQTE